MFVRFLRINSSNVMKVVQFYQNIIPVMVEQDIKIIRDKSNKNA